MGREMDEVTFLEHRWLPDFAMYSAHPVLYAIYVGVCPLYPWYVFLIPMCGAHDYFPPKHLGKKCAFYMTKYRKWKMSNVIKDRKPHPNMTCKLDL